jgi:hypothetical protein
MLCGHLAIAAVSDLSVCKNTPQKLFAMLLLHGCNSLALDDIGTYTNDRAGT